MVRSVSGADRPGESRPETVRFGGGRHASLVAADGSGAAAALEAIGLESCDRARPVIVVCGGAARMGAAALRRTMAVLGPAVVTAAESVAAGVASSDIAAALAVVDGG